MEQLPFQIVAIAAKTDESWFQRLTMHLSLYRRKGLLTLWHTSLILPTRDIIQERNHHLDDASLFLLFLSPDFFASGECQEQLQRVMQRHDVEAVPVLPLFVRPVDISHSPLATIQGLPSKGRAIVEWNDYDSALQDIVTGIRTLLFPPTPHAQHTSSARIITTPTLPGENT